MVKTSDDFWKGYTLESWRTFVQHDFGNPSREMFYKFLKEYIFFGEHSGSSFCEIGFGGAYDFKTCFKELDDRGDIRYFGIDRTEEFVEYAKTDFPGYNWEQGGFETLGERTFDITYARHILQHAAPEVYQDWIRAMLGATNEMAVIVWHPKPSVEHFHYDGGWNCTYDKKTVDNLIRSLGFSIEEIPAGDEDTFYIMRIQ